MPTLRPDPTFYPSPGMAMQAPAERLAYVTMLNVDKNGGHDAMGVVDLDPASTTYGPPPTDARDEKSTKRETLNGDVRK